MFTRSLELWHDRRRHAMPAPARRAPANDNRFDRRPANGSQRAARPVLVCRWRAQPATGRLECVWQIKATDGVSTEEPRPRREARRAMRA
jgi:hypothetical protein